MHITDTTLKLGSRHSLEAESIKTVTLERIRDPGDTASFRGTFEKVLSQLADRTPADTVPSDQAACCHVQEQKQDMLETMLAMLFGHEKSVPSSSPPPLAGDANGAAAVNRLTKTEVALKPHWQITRTEQHREAESCEFSASGNVCLADGSQRQFNVEFEFQRSEETTLTSTRSLMDPLVIDSAVPRAALSGSSIEFDLNQDGKLEQMRMPDQGSAYLFLDRNRNGRADDGGELFGPETGNGFAELARLDSDHNGWIDSADAAFADLKLWSTGEHGQQRVRAVAEAGIGAFATTATETPFQLKENGATLGRMRSSSVWLGETGGAGTIRQIDLATTPVPDRQTPDI